MVEALESLEPLVAMFGEISVEGPLRAMSSVYKFADTNSFLESVRWAKDVQGRDPTKQEKAVEYPKENSWSHGLCAVYTAFFT